MKWGTMTSNYKKINVVSQFWPPLFIGGGEISTYITSRELANRGYEVTVLTPNVPVDKDKCFRFIKLYNPIYFLEPFEKKYFSKISYERDLPEGVYWASDFYGACFLWDKKVRKVVTVRDHWPIYKSSQNIFESDEIIYTNIQKKISRTFKYFYNREFRRSILSRFNHTVFVSNYIANKITTIIPLKNYSVIYNPISTEYINKSNLKNFINKNIIFSGSVKEYKGIDVLLRAMRILIRNDKKFSLTIVGGGDLNKYKEMVNKLGLSRNVKFIGKIKNEEIVKYYDISTLVVIPGLWFEPFGRVVIEGMSRKCISIATNQGGPTEIIENAKTGFLFEKGDYSQLAKIIVKLYQNPGKIKTIQEKARNFAIKKFSPEKIAKQYEILFNSI